MRLTKSEIEIIVVVAKKYFGSTVRVFLFGSRVDDFKKGGDIDLFIKTDNENQMTIDLKIQFLVELKSLIGDQKIDVVIDNEVTRAKLGFYHSIIEHNTELRLNS